MSRAPSPAPRLPVRRPPPVPASVIAAAARHPVCGFLSVILSEFAS